MRSPEQLRALVEGYLGDLALTPELHGQAESVRYALVGGKRDRLASRALGGRGEVPPHLDRFALAVDLEHRALRIRGDEDDAFGGALADRERARRAAIHGDDRLAGKQTNHGDVRRRRAKRCGDSEGGGEVADFHRSVG